MSGETVDETGQRIKRAALRRFADVGYGSVTIDDIATDAGVGVATLYRRWPDKAALANALMADHLTEFEARSEPLEGSTPKQRFMTLWRRMWDLVQSDPERFVFAEAHAYAGFMSAENVARKFAVGETGATMLAELEMGASVDVAGALLNGTATQIARYGTEVDRDELGERMWSALRPTYEP